MLVFALLLAGEAHAQVRIVAFGDSNTYGMNMAREQSYPAQLAGEFRAVTTRMGEKFGAVPCNFREGVPASGYAGDGHENAEGNTAVAKNLMRIVEPMVR